LLGDTDSAFTMWRTPQELTDLKTTIKALATQVAATCSHIFHPCELQVENLFPKFWMFPKKKTYLAQKFSKDTAVKGMVTKKRDKCGHAQAIGMEVCTQILDQNGILNINDYTEWLTKKIHQVIPKGKIVDADMLKGFILTSQLGKTYKNKDTSVAVVISQELEKKTGFKVQAGDRVKYVQVHLSSKKKAGMRVDGVRPVFETNWTLFFQQDTYLDMDYYLRKQIRSCLKQILQLPEHAALLNATNRIIERAANNWLQHMNRISSQTKYD
jgi:DNA polymerase elongation subunit (family B)